MSFPGFTEFSIAIEGSETPVNIFGVHKKGPSPDSAAVLLVHGFPQSHLIWHKIAPKLTEKYSVVAIDLRGYGKSSKPSSKDDSSHSLYSKRSMANDCVAVMKSLGYDRFYYIGHDRGARVGHRLCIDHPKSVIKIILLDIAPTLAMYMATDMEFATAYFHWFFLIQPSPFPETFLTSNAEFYVNNALSGQLKSSNNFVPSHVSQYINVLGTYEGAHAACEDYRAAATIDLEHDRKDVSENRKVTVPMTILWGKDGVIAKQFNGLKLWSDVADSVAGHPVSSGHYIPDDAPDDVLQTVEAFF
ncbi:hypothetical protein AWJ20_2685 [Sugiyamaella lignohabitans]|uniref:AB hydrolase-1 domain-containing protein n=1 Tax=Sugiyamaella lignohabitans TaxID=796027 RepID=A0A167FBD2_9ASCO|nr:uncharacterized protein AWJ20_2685 [Sugiyamaella lignohabitans]ANB15065.1 hypothetical protein AWJ20_2685 [Sugiyamaella lignohabitans]